jgi:hypothetical protein
VVDEITGQHRRNSLVADVFNVLGALSGASDMAPSVSADLAATIRKMRAATPNSKAAKQLVHSVGGEQGMLKRIVPPPGRSVRRIVIVSPGHSINGSALAQHFGDLGLLSDQPQVDIYTGLDGPDQLPIFSPSFIAGLRHRGATVELHGVPGAEIVDGRSQNRPLHAKLIATVDDQEDALSLAGSANCSPSGWLGKNREAMVLQHGTARHLDRLISELRAKPKAFDPVAPPPQATSAASSGNPPAGLPVLDSLRRQGDDLIGSISLAGLMKDGSKVVGVRLGGRKIIVEALARDLQIPERNAVIEVTVEHADGTKQTFRFQLGGGMPEWHPHLWRADPDDVPDRTDAWLLALIGDLRTASSKAGHKSNFLPSAADDAYRVPLYRRLALVARHHRALQDSLAKDDLVQAIDRYFVGQERAVALSLVTNQPAADGAILAALNDVVTGRA